MQPAAAESVSTSAILIICTMSGGRDARKYDSSKASRVPPRRVPRGVPGPDRMTKTCLLAIFGVPAFGSCNNYNFANVVHKSCYFTGPATIEIDN